MQTIAYLVVCGLMIGLFISAPMGPVGVLVIQRTLNKGRREGLLTGLGASLSDIFYCLLSGFGLSFVADFINDNSTILQLIGSIVLVGYGIYLFINNPSRKIQEPKVKVRARTTDVRDFVTGFLLTVSNPLILFFIIGLFSRFNFLDMPQWPIHHIVGYTSIAIGAVGWWFFVTYIINKLRRRFTYRTMRRINQVIALLIILMAGIGLVTSIHQLLNF